MGQPHRAGPARAAHAAPIYREGTIGADKEDLEATAATITKTPDGAASQLPAGGIDPGEHPMDAAAVEVFEETGCKLQDGQADRLSRCPARCG